MLSHSFLIGELPRDLVRLQDVDVTRSEAWKDAVERVRFLAEATYGRVEIAFPQMQGPLTNAARLMDHAEMIMACHTDPQSMQVLSNTWADIRSRLVLALGEVAGDPALLRPRVRFYQPRWIGGLIVGDYLVLIRPERYREICADAWQTLYDRLGPICYHTCGPVWRSLGVLKGMPGLAGFECAYVRGQRGRTTDLAEVKRRLDGKIVLHHFEWPLGGTVEDPENLTAEWLRAMNEGGGFMIHDSGPVDAGKALFRRLELA